METLTFEVPIKVADQLSQLAEDQGKTMTQILIELVEKTPKK
jgi:hypothetical protein